MNRTAITCTTIAALSMLGSAALLTAGPLTPPSGPVASTYKTLSEVEPRIAVNATNTPGNAFARFRLTQPGSYYLTGNLSVAGPETWCIEIAASGVTLDLSGFTIDGSNVSGGIAAGAGSGVTIRRVAFSGIGADLFPTGSPGLTVENVRVLNVVGPNVPPGGSAGAAVAGIFVGRGGIIRNCYVSDAPTGIAAGFNANVSGCTVEFARQTAFSLQGGATITDCVAVGTGGGPTNGGQGFVIETGSTAVNCVARSNTGVGFALGNDTSAKGCSSTNNAGGGFTIKGGTSLESCTASGNQAPGVTTAIGSYAWSIERCVIVGNDVAGISVSGSSGHAAIRGSTIRAASPSGPPGIIIPATASDVVISGNAFGFSTRSIQLDANYCIVTNNSFNFTAGIAVTAGGGAPPATNMIGPLIGPGNVGVATNPFANLAQ